MRQHATAALTPAAAGRRVVVRHRLHDDRYAATDVLGVLESWAGGVLSIRTATGDLVRVAQDDVIAAKVIPARTITRRDVRDLETAAALGWQGTEAERLGGWLLRAGLGFTGRANSCLPLDDPGLPLPRAVDAVEAWYRDRGLRPAFYVPEPLAGALDDELETHGWDFQDPTIVMTAPVDDIAALMRDDLPEVRVGPHADDAWLAGYHYRGGELPTHAVRILHNAEIVGFASIDVPDGVADDVVPDFSRDAPAASAVRAAIGRAAVSTSPRGRVWVGVTAVEVAADHRRRGLGTQVVAGLAAWSAGHDASDMYLQVAADNTAALRTYENAGFTEHHRYHYRRLGTPPP